MVNEFKQLICDLESWAAQIVACYQAAADLEGADDLEAVVRCYTADIRRRRVQNRDGTPADLAELKRGICLAAFLLQATQDDEPEAMQGWQYRAGAQNLVQDTYSIIYEIVMELTKSVCEIEAEYPEMAGQFDAERAAYKARLSDLNSEMNA